MRLGQLIEALANVRNENKPVRFSDGTYPGDIASWRGVYADLAIEPTNDMRTVGGLLSEARKARGGTFQGYKGGDFKMTSETAVWVSAWGLADEVMILRAREEDDALVLDIALRLSEYAW